METIRWIKLDPRAKAPLYASEQAAGADLFALTGEPLRIPGGIRGLCLRAQRLGLEAGLGAGE